MKKILILAGIALSITMTSCFKDPISSETKGDFQVEFLFEKDGLKMYRFYDGRYHYFTNKGEAITTQTSGKDKYEETIKQQD
jgi:hypothetical protein